MKNCNLNNSPNRSVIDPRTLFGVILTLTLLSITLAAQDTPTLEDVSARLAQLAEPEKGLPESEILLYEEKRRVEEELEEYRTLSRKMAASTKESNEAATKLSQNSKEFLQNVSGLNCDPLDQKKVDELLRKLRSIQMSIFSDFDFQADENPWDSIRVSSRDKPEKSDVCLALKGIDENKRLELQLYIDNGIKESEKTQDESKKLQTQSELLVHALQKRQAALQAKLSSRESQQTISDKLWLIILAIGALSIGTIVTIKLFDQPLQVEWVASGQVIQFVTVMILLSVVMALGLANVLKENTLGTLLGGLAGYVLSQGVGRAAAREVSRGLDRQQTGDTPTGSS